MCFADPLAQTRWSSGRRARQRRDIEDYATEHGAELAAVYDEGKRASGFDTDRPEYTALREHVADGNVLYRSE